MSSLFFWQDIDLMGSEFACTCVFVKKKYLYIRWTDLNIHSLRSGRTQGTDTEARREKPSLINKCIINKYGVSIHDPIVDGNDIDAIMLYIIMGSQCLVKQKKNVQC
jgi:hypothetical protein